MSAKEQDVKNILKPLTREVMAKLLELFPDNKITIEESGNRQPFYGWSIYVDFENELDDHLGVHLYWSDTQSCFMYATSEDCEKLEILYVVDAEEGAEKIAVECDDYITSMRQCLANLNCPR